MFFSMYQTGSGGISPPPSETPTPPTPPPLPPTTISPPGGE